MADMTYPIFVALDATALEGGAIYIGAANQDPEISPIDVFWDEALTLEAEQPIRTSGGVIVRDGTPSQVYAADAVYSLRVYDRNNRVVWYKPVTGGQLNSSRLSFPIPTGPASEIPGPADNTYISYTTLLASDPSRKSARLVGDTDVPPQPDGNFNYDVASGMWVRQAADGIAYSGRSAAEKLADFGISAQDKGAVADLSGYDGTDNRAALQSALDALAENGGGTLLIPGKFKVVGQLVIKSDARIVGVGGASLTQIPTNGGPFIGSDGGAYAISFEELEIAGDWGRANDWSASNHLIEINHATSVTATRCRFLNSRKFGFVVGFTPYASAIECEFTRSQSDAVHFGDVGKSLVSFCRFKDINDDAIGIHTSDAKAAPVEAQAIVVGNDIQDSQGIAILGAKNTVITGNSLKRYQVRGIFVGVFGDTVEGNTAAVSVNISNNVLDTIFDGQVFSAAAGGIIAPIAVTAAAPTPVPGSGYVGEANGSGGVVLPWPYLFTNDTDANAPVAGQFNVAIKDNVCVSSLQPVGAYTTYGYGQRYSRTGPVNPAINATQLGRAAHASILLSGIANADVSGNLLGDMAYGIELSGVPGAAYMSHKAVKIEGGSISRFTTAGVLFSGTGYASVEGVTFDGDPYCLHANRAANGKWAAGYANNVALKIASTGRLSVKGCSFRNIGAVTDNPAEWYTWQGNTVYSDPVVADGYDTGNIGIGRMRSGAGIDAVQVIEGGDPGDAATFRRLKNACVRASGTMPATGKYPAGYWVANMAGATIGTPLGWSRLTTGSAHVAGIDWQAVYPVLQQSALPDIAAPPTQANFNALLAKLRAAGVLAS